MSKPFLVFAAIAILLFGCTGAQPLNPNVPPAGNITEPIPSPPNNTQLANPASVNCIQKGYSLEIRKDASGGEAGYCKFGNGRECEEWAFFRGECSEGGNAISYSNEGGPCNVFRSDVRCAEGLVCQPPPPSQNIADMPGTCVKPGIAFIGCPTKRGDMCTMDYSPVCGRSGSTPSTYGYKTYPNGCVACSKSSPAAGYAQGTCESLNLAGAGKEKGVLYDCPSERATVCTKELDPVCGRVVDPSSSASVFNDYANSCIACSTDSNAIAYYIGTCAER